MTESVLADNIDRIADTLARIREKEVTGIRASNQA